MICVKNGIQKPMPSSNSVASTLYSGGVTFGFAVIFGFAGYDGSWWRGEYDNPDLGDLRAPRKLALGLMTGVFEVTRNGAALENLYVTLPSVCLRILGWRNEECKGQIY